jgi:NDP-sugar pyrophosphorylase family protein
MTPATALSPVCILAGGLGSRLGDEVHHIPKPLLEVAGEPFLVHQLRLLAAAGVHRVVMCVGYLGELIEETLGPEQCGIALSYSHDGPELAGTLGAIRRAAPLLGERFLTLYGDTYLRIDYQAFDASWRSSGLPAAMTVLRNKGQWETSNAVYAEGLVTQYDKKIHHREMEWIDYGLGGLTTDALALVSSQCRDLADLYRVLADRHLLHGFEAINRFYDIGTPGARQETEEFLLRERDHKYESG